MHHDTIRSARLAVAALVAAGAAAGCSASNDRPDPSTPSTTPTTSASSTRTGGGDPTSVSPVATTGTTSSGGGQGPTVPPTAGAPCTARWSAMSAQRVEGSGAAGHYEIDVAARNDARVPCTMKGFPGVSLVDAKGAQLGAPASRIGGEGASVTVPAGGTARARVRVTQAGNLGCRVVPATGLLVYLPGEKQPLQAVIAGVQGCADTTSPLLQVKAFTG